MKYVNVTRNHPRNHNLDFSVGLSQPDNNPDRILCRVFELHSRISSSRRSARLARAEVGPETNRRGEIREVGEGVENRDLEIGAPLPGETSGFC